MKLLPLSLLLITVCCVTPLAWGEESAAAAAPSSRAQLEQATVTGTVTAINPQRHSFSLKEAGADEASEYRAYFRDGKQQAVLDLIKALKVGDVRTVTYTEAEGRRALAITTPASDAK